jgi:hypothetical protein
VTARRNFFEKVFQFAPSWKKGIPVRGLNFSQRERGFRNGEK